MDIADFAYRDFLIKRIISGTLRLKMGGNSYLIDRPTSEDLYIASSIYWETYYEAEAGDCLTRPQLMDFLYSNGIWSDKLQKQLEQSEKDLENAKVGLFENKLKTEEKRIARNLIRSIKFKIDELYAKLHQYDYVTCGGVAQIAKQRYIIASCLKDSNGNKLFSQDLWRENIDRLDLAISLYNDSIIPDKDLRYLARTEPWRTIWMSSKYCTSIFGVAASELTDEQKTLIMWSRMFDNIYESTECPTEEVIEDDDMLDGWLILQRRKREADKAKVSLDDSIRSEKIKNAEELFVVVETPEDAKKIGDMNDAHTNKVRKQRLDYIMEKGEVNELSMPDTKQRMMMEFVQMQRQRGKK